ncbi:MDR family MFS transporter [Brevibacillus daliensis]|uniref:MDR family MFS transporter n=1 Tax=Brevibacillus daliensis TaxID=2892995 RepID=UPI001E65BAA9|nr:MFS transporter [Brevibacillus daliensis]
MSWLQWDTNLKIRLVGETFFSIFLWMLLPFMTLYFSDQFGKNIAGLLLIIPPILGMGLSLFGGRLADKLGRRPIMLVAVGIQAIMFFIFFLSSSPWLDFFAFTGLTLGASLYHPASEAMVADLTNEEERNFVFAMFYTAMNLGVVAGPLLGAFFFVHYRTELLFACMLVSLAMLLVYFFILRETKPEQPKQSDKTNVAIKKKESWLLNELRSFKIIFTDKVFGLYILAGTAVFMAFLQMDLYMAVYIKENVTAQSLIWWGNWSFNLEGASFFGWMMALNGFMVVTLTAAITRSISAWSDKKAFMVASLLGGLGFFLMSFSSNIWYLFFCMMVLTLGELIRTPVALGFISKYAPEHQRGQYMGASTLQFTFGRTFAPLLVTLSSLFGPFVIFSMIFLFALLSIYFYQRMFASLEKREKSLSA